ncbi:MAG: hypothetical protein XXXJIFNMEKO3_00618 [Candidatus Erwinia impunctatus]
MKSLREVLRDILSLASGANLLGYQWLPALVTSMKAVAVGIRRDNDTSIYLQVIDVSEAVTLPPQF